MLVTSARGLALEVVKETHGAQAMLADEMRVVRGLLAAGHGARTRVAGGVQDDAAHAEIRAMDVRLHEVGEEVQGLQVLLRDMNAAAAAAKEGERAERERERADGAEARAGALSREVDHVKSLLLASVEKERVLQGELDRLAAGSFRGHDIDRKIDREQVSLLQQQVIEMEQERADLQQRVLAAERERDSARGEEAMTQDKLQALEKELMLAQERQHAHTARLQQERERERAREQAAEQAREACRANERAEESAGRKKLEDEYERLSCLRDSLEVSLSTLQESDDLKVERERELRAAVSALTRERDSARARGLDLEQRLNLLQEQLEENMSILQLRELDLATEREKEREKDARHAAALAAAVGMSQLAKEERDAAVHERDSALAKAGSGAADELSRAMAERDRAVADARKCARA